MYSYVYFITDNNGHIKIGKADNTVKRLNELQTGNPYKLSIILTVMMPSINDAFSLEQELHQLFKDYRLEGEWFEAEPVLKVIDVDIVKLNKFQFGGLKYGKVKEV